MRNQNLQVAEPVRQKLAAVGVAGQQWLETLPDLVAELEQEWQLSVGGSLEGGSEAYVAEATTSTGEKAVLKITIPHMNGNTVLANEISGLELAAGRGYVGLLRSDLTRRALLLERLGRTLKALGYSPQVQIELICVTLRQSWVPVPPDAGLPFGASPAEWFSQFVGEKWEQLGRPCSSQAFEVALGFAEKRAGAFDPARAVLVHGDAHNGNTLQSLSDPAVFKLIDPDGLVAETAYDLGVLMREWLDEIIPDPVRLSRERCAYLRHLTGADEQAIWHWGFLQMMATGLLLIQVGQEQAGRQMLMVAERLSSFEF